MPRFERSIVIPASVEEVYAFHLDTRNAARIAPRGQVVEILEGTFPLVQGAEVVLRMRQRPLPVWQRWRVRVRELVEPVLVVDELVEGPFARFVHEHRFEPLPDGGTRLTDRIELALPLGLLGRLAAPLVLLAMRPLFAQRQRATARLFAERAAQPA